MNYLKDYLYTKLDTEGQRFYQMPKVLFENQFYNTLSIGAKTVYMIVRDRQDLSISNDWHDKNGFVFSYFDNDKLANVMNVSRSSIARYKKELEKHYLIVQVRQGQGKPNKWYILKPTTVDFTLKEHFDTSRRFKLQHLELSKLLTNETECIETDLIILNTYVTLSSNAPFLSFYLSAYMDYFNKEHMRVNRDTIASIDQGLEDISESIDYEEYTEMVISYFEQLPDSNNGNILSMLKAKDRYLLSGEW